MKTFTHHILPLSIFLLLAAACGRTAPKVDVTGNMAEVNNILDNIHKVSAAVTIQAENGAGLNLAGNPGDAITVYEMKLDSCTSLNSATFTGASVDVYEQDTGCLVKVNSFTYNGLNFALKDGQTPTWAADERLVFTNLTGSVTTDVTVHVITQLNNPITASEAVSFAVTAVQNQGTSTIAHNQLFNSASVIMLGYEAPKFHVKALAGVELVKSPNQMDITLHLECDAAVTMVDAIDSNGNPITNILCGAEAMQSMSYKIIEDTYSGTLNMAQARSIFATAGDAIPSNMTTEVATLDAAVLGSFNGGMSLTKKAVTLAEIKSGKKYLFILRSEKDSYSYFPLQFAQ